MSAGRWNQSALKPHLVSNSKNIKDYYPRRQKGHEHLLQRVHAKFRRTISQGNTVTIQHPCQCKICEGLFLLCTQLKKNMRNVWSYGIYAPTCEQHVHLYNMTPDKQLVNKILDYRDIYFKTTCTLLNSLFYLYVIYLFSRSHLNVILSLEHFMCLWLLWCYWGYSFGLLWHCSERLLEHCEEPVSADLW